MLGDVKYVVTTEGCLIFSAKLIHASVAWGMGKVLGAGFVRLEYDDRGEGELRAICYGESISLDVKSRGEEDADIIKRQLLS